MRVAASGPYVMVKKFGIEGLISLDKAMQDAGVSIQSNTEKEEARVVFSDGRKDKVLKVFDSVMVEIRAEMIEYRRTVQLVLLI